MPGSDGPDDGKRQFEYAGVGGYAGNTSDKASRMRQARRRRQSQMDSNRVNPLDIGLSVDDVAPDDFEDLKGFD